MESERQVIYNLYHMLPDDVQQHCFRVSVLLKELGKTEQLNINELELIGIAHDIGKFYIPDSILYKPDKLTTLERQIIDQHSFYGYQMLKEKGIKDDIAVPVLYHHSFTPPVFGNFKLPVPTKKQIHYSEALKIVDVFDALKEKRTYKEAFSDEDIANIMFNNFISIQK